MAWWNRDNGVPSELAGLLLPNERILAWATHHSGVIAATTQALVSTDHHDSKRIPWTHVLSAKWEGSMLTINLAPDLSSLGWLIDEPGQLPVAVRDRVTAHIVVDRTRRFNDQEVRFIAHRGETDIEWLTIAQDADWAHSPQGQASIQAELVSLRSTLGV